MQQDVEISVRSKSRPKTRQRASIACQSCNNKRIKCNAASVGLPCSNCQRATKTCRLIESRRGQRKTKRVSDLPEKESRKEYQQNGLGGDMPWDERISSHAATIVAINKDNEKDVNNSTPHTLEGSKGRLCPEDNAEILQQQASPLTQDQVDFAPQCSDGEMASEASAANSLEAAYRAEASRGLPNAFDLPKSDTCLQLFKAYFEHVAPSCPIIDRADFMFQYAIPQRPPSSLLLYAVLFMAAGHCEEGVLKDGGFESRVKARQAFFRRSKALYDADDENDKFTIVQATFLMSFWWDSPLPAKDDWYWLGISINQALAIGMHRSTKDSEKSLKTQRLWKRLWWSLFSADKYSAATLGRPIRLRSSDCSVEPFETADFEGEPYGFGHTFKVGLPQVILAYPVCMTDLSKIAERIIEDSPQIAKPSNSSPELRDAMLQVWEAALPGFLQYVPNQRSDYIWPSMIRITTCWLRILLYRTHLQVDFPRPFLGNTHQKAIEAAYEIVRIMEDLLILEKIQLCPATIIPALFAAMSILASIINSGRGASRRLATLKHKVCVIVLQELEGSWPISRSILSAFAESDQDIFNRSD